MDLANTGEATADASWFGAEYENAFRIVDTDYETYIIVYGCHNTDDKNSAQMVGISVRDPNISEEDLNKIKQIAKEKVEANLSNWTLEDDLMQVKQGDECKYFDWGRK